MLELPAFHIPAVSENDQRLDSPDVISCTAVQKFCLKTAKDKSISLEKTTGQLVVCAIVVVQFIFMSCSLLYSLLFMKKKPSA
jgi:hypothetical protein